MNGLNVGCLLLLLICGRPLWATVFQVQHTENSLHNLLDRLHSNDEFARADAADQAGVRGGAAVGAEQRSIVKALIEHLAEPSDSVMLDHVITALGRIGDPVVRHVLGACKDPRRRVRIAAIRVFEEMTSSARELSVPTLARLTVADSSEDVRFEAAMALAKIGPKGVPHLLTLLRARSDDEKEAAAVALGNVENAPNDVIIGLESLLSDPSRDVRRQGIWALGNITPPVTSALDAIEHSLLTDSEPLVRSTAAEATGKIRAQRSVGPLRTALLDQNILVRTVAARALGKYGPSAKVAINDLLRILSEPDPEPPPKDLHENAAEALSLILVDDAGGFEILISGLDSPDLSVRHYVLAAIQATSQAVHDRATSLSDREISAWYELFGRALPSVQASSFALATDQAIKSATADALARSINRLQQERSDRSLRRSLVLARRSLALLATIVAVTLPIAASVTIRRRLLILAGRRWSLILGKCDYSVELLGDRIQTRSLIMAQPLVHGFNTPEWPPRSDELDRLRAGFDDGSDVLVSIEKDRFWQPWAHELATQWSQGRNAVIAGQVCVATDSLNAHPFKSRNIVFAGFACARGANLEALPNAERELENASKQFTRWGAEARIQCDARVQDVRFGLQEADVVHVASHGEGRGLHLMDRMMTATDLPVLPQLRCSLLVLSACDIGLMKQDDSFVYTLVRAGTNVLAATQRIGDSVCSVFFEEFYRCFLPSRQAVGMSISAAIRDAVETCSHRFSTVEEALLPEVSRGKWKSSIDSLIFYGDPSAHFALLTRRNPGANLK